MIPGPIQLAAAPKLIVDTSSKLDGSPVLQLSAPGTGLWLKLKAAKTNAILQNSLELLNDSGDSLGSIGGTAKSKDLGKKLIYVAAGETQGSSKPPADKKTSNRHQLKSVSRKKQSTHIVMTIQATLILTI